MAKSSLVGKVFSSNGSGDFVVIEYNKKEDVWIQFLNTGFTLKIHVSAIRQGAVKDPFSPRYYGVGYLGIGEFSYKEKRIYHAWTNMLARCYSGRFPSYEGCIVAEEWHNFQNFARWFIAQENWDVKGYELDKDLKHGKRGKLYSPETCSIIKRRSNLAIIRQQSTNTSGSTGVSIYHTKSGIRYRVWISINGESKYIGSYLTREEAEIKYEEMKSKYINENFKEKL